jgi:hypothetical protein
LAATSDKFGKTVGQDSEEHEARQVKEWSENNKVFARQATAGLWPAKSN